MRVTIKTLVLIGALLPVANAQASCGGAFCNLSTDWDVQATPTKQGVRLDVHAEFIDLDQLRHGTHKAQAQGVLDEHDEIRTLNRNLVTSLDWNISPQWGLTLRVPLVDRAHKHFYNDVGGPELETWDFSGIGDVQAIARYGFYQDETSNAGVRFGLKLPTGSISKKNSDGEQAERTLQPGSGSVDSLLGAYYNHRMGNIAWFVQGQWQQTVHERDDFKPGRKLGLDLGLNYSATPDLNLLLQLNLQHKSRDSGSNAEPQDSGGRSVYLTPGVSYRVTSSTQLYGFLQKPIYQYVNGAQLTADWSVSFGVTTLF